MVCFANTIWILGLPHSGTTIFWKSWRKDDRFLCFDEPLSAPQDLNQGTENSRGTLKEFRDLLGTDPSGFWARFEPIHPLQELDHEFTAGQMKWLEYLLEHNEHLVVDETHLHRHVAALFSINPGGHLIHLYRRASSFATSHFVPKPARTNNVARAIVRNLRYAYDRYSLWRRFDFLPGMMRGAVIGSHPQSKFACLLDAAGYDVKRIMQSPALVRLLAYWHYHYHYLEHEGPRVFGERFRSVRYEDFANDPQQTMTALYEWIGVAAPKGVTYKEVHAPKPAFRAGDRRWCEAARIAGFSELEIATLL